MINNSTFIDNVDRLYDSSRHVLNMEWEIFNLLKLLKITKKFVYRTIKPFNEFNTIEDKPRSGRPREIRTNAAVKAVA
ncbi:cytoplasmic tRNA 2-thiolation protein 2 isoform X2, partial [Aphis craccivora]